MAIFRNEASVMKEFIDHYIDQGIDHFYLIDNMSEDDGRAIAESYGDIVTMFEEPYVAETEVLKLGGRQVEAYNENLCNVDTDWLYVCDLDELAYARNGYANIKDFVEKNQDKANQFLIPLRTFTSNGLIEEPKSMTEGFTERWDNEVIPLMKPLLKTDAINRIEINYATLKSGVTMDTHLVNTSDNLNKDSFDPKAKVEWRNLLGKNPQDACVVSNHYQTRSKDWYFKVKATRGTATWHGGDEMPAIEWFTRMWERIHRDVWSPVQDDELVRIRSKQV